MTTTREPTSCVSLKDMSFAFGQRDPVLVVSEFAVGMGEKLFVHGPSGSGKSTLLGLIAGVLEPQRGNIHVLGHDLSELSAAKRDLVRADRMGVIFQQFNLVPYLDLVENVLLPCRFAPSRAKRIAASPQERDEIARNMLTRLGLGHEIETGQVVSELSTGQQQRVAAARALIGTPSLIIADEPTSALDAGTRSTFIETLLSEAKNASVVFVSHDLSLAQFFDRQVSMAVLNDANSVSSTGQTRQVQQVGSI